MRTSRFTDEQIVPALRKEETGTAAADLCRKLKITVTIFYRWKQKFQGLDDPKLREFNQLRDEDRELKQLVADLSLGKPILRGALRKSGEAGAASRARAVSTGDHQLSERRACAATSVARSSMQDRSGRPPQTPLRVRLRELVIRRVSYGYLRLHVLLRREGWPVNHKRIYRLYTEEGRTLARRRPRRRESVAARPGRPSTTDANERWGLSFLTDMLATGRTSASSRSSTSTPVSASRRPPRRVLAVRTWRSSSTKRSSTGAHCRR